MIKMIDIEECEPYIGPWLYWNIMFLEKTHMNEVVRE